MQESSQDIITEKHTAVFFPSQQGNADLLQGRKGNTPAKDSLYCF